MNDAASRARHGGRRALGAPLIKKCAILSAGSALDQLYAGKCDECGVVISCPQLVFAGSWLQS
ncbi:hypothetical protein DJ480_03810 [Pseudomonas sp. Leaf98]|nr:hypothetical protein DJ480_03810 [Pseudomonas sp. Leaf98]